MWKHVLAKIISCDTCATRHRYGPHDEVLGLIEVPSTEITPLGGWNLTQIKFKKAYEMQITINGLARSTVFPTLYSTKPLLFSLCLTWVY
ncbi:hypothetical protein WAI453_006043 [Rhynchosporium graminicola]